MDSLNKKFIWLTDPSPEFTKEFSGSFVTSLEGVPCTLELEVNNRSLNGWMAMDGTVFELRGVVSMVINAAYGVMFEPLSNTPIALLKMTPMWWGVKLEMDMPDFEDFVNLYEPHAFQFRRISPYMGLDAHGV